MGRNGIQIPTKYIFAALLVIAGVVMAKTSASASNGAAAGFFLAFCGLIIGVIF